VYCYWICDRKFKKALYCVCLKQATFSISCFRKMKKICILRICRVGPCLLGKSVNEEKDHWACLSVRIGKQPSIALAIERLIKSKNSRRQCDTALHSFNRASLRVALEKVIHSLDASMRFGAEAIQRHKRTTVPMGISSELGRAVSSSPFLHLE
jgi:hypothetical protein